VTEQQTNNEDSKIKGRKIETKTSRITFKCK